MFKFTTRKELKKTISVQDNTISTMRKDVAMYQSAERNKNLEIIRLASENAVLKQRIINLEEQLNLKLQDAEKLIKQYQETGLFVYKSGENEIHSSKKFSENVEEELINIIKEELKNAKPVSVKLQKWLMDEKENIKKSPAPTHYNDGTIIKVGDEIESEAVKMALNFKNISEDDQRRYLYNTDIIHNKFPVKTDVMPVKKSPKKKAVKKASKKKSGK